MNTFKLLGATPDEAGGVVETAIAALVKEVEPLLQDAKPFFGGSDRLTLAEVGCAADWLTVGFDWVFCYSLLHYCKGWRVSCRGGA